MQGNPIKFNRILSMSEIDDVRLWPNVLCFVIYDGIKGLKHDLRHRVQSGTIIAHIRTLAFIYLCFSGDGRRVACYFIIFRRVIVFD